MESRRNGPQLSSRHDDDDDELPTVKLSFHPTQRTGNAANASNATYPTQE